MEDGADALLADFFTPAGRPLRASAVPSQDALGASLTWEELSPRPPGMVARVQWSHDPAFWQESGGTADGLTRTIVIQADGSRRTAHVLTEPAVPAGPALPLFLRVVVTAGELPPSPAFPPP